MITENLSMFKIHKLTQAQYDRELEAGRIDENALYITSEESANASNLSMIFNAIYPVGSIYMSVNNVNPGTLFGGTWLAWGDGRVPVGVDQSAEAIRDVDFASSELTGGEKNHALTTSELPAHKHVIPALSGTATEKTLEGWIGNIVVESQTSFKMTGGGICTPRTITSGGVSAGGQSSSSDKEGRSDFFDVNATHDHTVTTTKSNTENTGSGAAHNNMPPYITCYMWKRVA